MEIKDSYVAATVLVLIAVGLCEGSQQGYFDSTPPADTSQLDRLLQSPATSVAGQSAQTPTGTSSGSSQLSPVANGTDRGQSNATQSSSQAGSLNSTPPRVMVNNSPLIDSGVGSVMINGQLMVPASALASQLGATVKSDSGSNTLKIDSPNQPPMTITAFGSDSDSPYESFQPDQFMLINGRAYTSVGGFGQADDGTISAPEMAPIDFSGMAQTTNGE